MKVKEKKQMKLEDCESGADTGTTTSEDKETLLHESKEPKKLPKYCIHFGLGVFVTIAIIVTVTPNYLLSVYLLNSSKELLGQLIPGSTGWTLMLQRTVTNARNDSLWNQNFNGYKSGFGSPDSDYWLGLDNIYSLVQNGNYQLRIEVQLKSDGQWYSVVYSTFSISDASTGYQLTVSGLNGDTNQLGDPLLSKYAPNMAGYVSNGMLFSTTDNEKQANSQLNCAKVNRGGWWFNNCYYFCPTCNQTACFGCGGFGLWTSARLLLKKSD